MNTKWSIIFILLTLTISIGFIGCSTIPVETIFWEVDSDGFIQFCTNDSAYYYYSFLTWDDEYYQPVMKVVETEVKKISGYKWGSYGIVFCVQDGYNFYLLLIDSMGYYTVYEQNGGTWIEHIGWTWTDTLKTGYNRINILKVEYDNPSNTFTIRFNDSAVNSFYDRSFSGGSSGYFVEVWGEYEEDFPETPVDVRFKQVQSQTQQAPIADAGPDQTVFASYIVNLDGSGSYDPDGTIVSYAWDFGDGNNGSGLTTTHIYSTEGTYNVTLTVADNAGLTDTDSMIVTVYPYNEPPVADAGSDQTVFVGDTVYFDGSGSYDPDGTIDSYLWDFGDGYTGSGVTTTHSYTTVGNYTVTLTVTDNNSITGSDNLTVTVFNEQPIADAGPDQTVFVGDTVYFDGSGSYDFTDIIVSYSWDFGDGYTGSGVITSHTYLTVGSYTVILTVYDEQGNSDTDTMTVNVLDTIEELAAEYLFNGDANDTSGNGNDGTVYGASLTTDRFGNANSAYNFDGIDDYIEIQDDIGFNFGTQDFTVSVWVKTNAITSYYNRDEIISKGDPTINGFAISIRSNKAIFFTGPTGEFSGISDLNDGTWHHIVGTRDDSNNVELYIDGISERTGVNSENVDTLYNLFIGKHGTKNESYFEGIIDDIRIYNRAITVQEIQALYGERGWTGN